MLLELYLCSNPELHSSDDDKTEKKSILYIIEEFSLY